MKRGRPVGSSIRQNIVEILFIVGSDHGYDIYRIYSSFFPKATMRSIYYNLRKGVETGEFLIDRVETEKGDYSWGNNAQKTYYRLGNAQARGNEELMRFIETQKQAAKNG